MAEMKLPPEAQQLLMQMQVDQQNMQGIAYQREMFKEQKASVDFALTNLAKTTGDVFKIAGPIIIKSEREDLKKELEEQKEMIDINLKKMETQEKQIRTRLEDAQKKIEGILKQGKKADDAKVDYEA